VPKVAAPKRARDRARAKAGKLVLEDAMSEGALFVKFWEKEGPATRKVLSRIPEGSDYRPDPKSRPAREIAWLIVREEIALAEGLRKGVRSGPRCRRRRR
jgi:hypothetical protein